MSLSLRRPQLRFYEDVFRRKESRGRSWVLFLIFNVCIAVVCSLILVWTNIDSTNTLFSINVQRNDLREKQALRAKLEVEKERLLSPYELRQKADQYGMHEPRPGQIRRMQVEK